MTLCSIKFGNCIVDLSTNSASGMFVQCNLLSFGELLTLEVTSGPNSDRAISADCAHGRNSAQFGMTL